MKTKLLSVLFLISLIAFMSCGRWIDTSLNVDPTGPKDASMNAILPTVELGIGYVLGGDIDRFTSLITQHHMGVARQHQAMYGYDFTEQDLDNAWTTSYTGPMEDLSVIMEKAKSSNSPHYQGIAEVLMANCLGMWTDILGDIPYSKAFLGASGNLKPTYNTQQEIYGYIQSLLDSAIIHLGASFSAYKPGPDDLMYSGDMSLWIKAAYTYKARYLLHVKNYAGALAALGNGFSGNSDNLQFMFGSTETAAGPFYQFMSQRGDISMGPALMTIMGDLKDPRIIAYTSDTVYSTDAYPAGFYTNPNSPVPFITFMEAKFIEAECQFAGGNTAAAYTAYTDAITASCEYFGVAGGDITAYLANPKVGVTAANLKITDIMTQKYIAMYDQSESWTDWRRTGIPVLTPVSGGQIPRRWLYPQSERLYNGANLAATTYNVSSPTWIFSKMYWDALW